MSDKTNPGEFKALRRLKRGSRRVRESVSQQIDKKALLELIEAYAEACFDCGEWSDSDGEPYDEFFERTVDLRRQIEEVLK